MKILFTGATGFVGRNLIREFNSEFECQALSLRNTEISGLDLINSDVFIHLAGNAHYLKKSSNSNDYYQVNTELTKKVYDVFLASDAKVFITLSSVKAAADEVTGVLTEEYVPNPFTHYGKSKLLAEQYIQLKKYPIGKRIYILRPCMIHGPGNKGNLNMLYKLVSTSLPWPLGSFENRRSFCSIDNLIFVIRELIKQEDIPSGIYNVADDEPLSTIELTGLIAQSLNRNPRVWELSKSFVERIAVLGDRFRLPLNSERLQKLTESYVVSNEKITKAIGKPLPVSSKEGLLKTFQSFNHQ